jgi:rhodanese-related sulfurtransferase
LALAAFAVVLIGQPTVADRWARLAPEKDQLLRDRAVQIHPGELLASMHDHKLKLEILDVRSEADYNLFHLRDARRVEASELPALSKQLLLEPANTVFILMSNDETAATEAWKVLAAESVPNVYILEGGVNNWLRVFGTEEPEIKTLAGAGQDCLAYTFPAAIGANYSIARPDPEEHKLEFTPKIQLKNKKGGGGGGCG